MMTRRTMKRPGVVVGVQDAKQKTVLFTARATWPQSLENFDSFVLEGRGVRGVRGCFHPLVLIPDVAFAFLGFDRKMG